MKLSKFLAGIAICIATTFALVSCQKDQPVTESMPTTLPQNGRASGLIEDDPALVAKVPMIVSDNFLKQSKEFPSTISFARGKPIKGGTDVTAPAISITSPGNATTVSGTLNVEAIATDNVGVSMVSLSVDGVLAGSDNSTPYSIPWNSASVSNGTHTLTVTARDAAGNTKSATVQVNVNTVSGVDNISPSVSISSPFNGASVEGTVTIQANASDNVAVSSLSFSIDGTVIGTDNSAPYGLSWNTATVASGIHIIAVTAADAAGNNGTASIQVTVNTTVVPPTTLPSSYQLVMPAVGHQGAEGSCVAFAVGYYTRSAEHYYRTGASTYSYTNNIFSPEFLFNQTKTSSDCGGSSVMSALDFVIAKGICTWQSMPYTSGDCSLAPTAAQTNEAAGYRISSYSTIFTSDIIALKTLLTQKHPLLLGVSTDQQFDNAGPGFIWSSHGSSTTSLHEITICGYDDARQAFKIINSWGTGWGDAGYSWISYDFLPTLNSYVFVMNN